MAFDLKDFRERKLMMTQEQFADFIGIRQDEVSRYEKDSDDMPKKIFRTIAEKTGQTLDELENYQKPIPEALPVTDTWRDAELTRRTLGDYLIQHDKSAWDAYEKAGELETEYRNIIDTNLQKPRIAFVGKSDTGKSAMINALLGVDKMPVSWTPTTSITVYICHMENRPDFISDDVWVFKGSADQPFTLSFLKNREKAESLRIAQGGIDILKQYGTRQGGRFADEATAAVIFVESGILKDVDLVDLPGFGTGDREADDVATRGTGELADVLVYLSRANGFMDGSDMTCLRQAISTLPVVEKKGENDIAPLGNLFIVASQAHVTDGGNTYQLKMILDTACTRFEQTLPDTLTTFFMNRSDISGYPSGNYFRDRFFTYTLDIPNLRKNFEKDLRTVIEQLPKRTISKTKDLLRTYAEDRGKSLNTVLEGYDRLLKNKDEVEAVLAEILKNEPVRQEENAKTRDGIVRDIEAYNDASLGVFTEKYNTIISIDNIVSVIKNRGFKKKKEDLEMLSNHVSALLEDAHISTIGQYSNSLKSKIDDYIAAFENSYQLEEKMGVKASAFSFDAKRAFASGLAGLAAAGATIGGLTFWAATLGNLGAYILVAKGVSLLSALGISIAGGTATATAAVAALGGPIVLGIALAVLAAIIAALAIFAIVSGGWQKQIAKKLVEEYQKQNVLEKYQDIIKNFWLNDTITAFNAAADAMEKAWQDEIANKKALIDNYDVEDIKRHIKSAEDFKGFLSHIPLLDTGSPVSTVG